MSVAGTESVEGTGTLLLDLLTSAETHMRRRIHVIMMMRRRIHERRRNRALGRCC